MISPLEQYRVFENPSSWIYFAGEQVDSPAELWHGKGVEDMGFKIEGMDAKTVGAKLQELYGPDKFEEVLRKYVNDIYPAEGNPDIKEQLITDPAEKYKTLFNHQNGIYAAFTKAIEKLQDAHDDAIESIKRVTREALDALHVEVKAARKAVDKTPKPDEVPAYAKDRMSQVPILGPINDGKLAVPILTPFLSSVNIPILSPALHSFEYVEYEQAREETQGKFQEYLNAVFDAFMTPEAYEDDLGERLRAGMLLQTKGKINFLFSEGKASKETLTALHQELEGRLNEYASLDGKAGNLSLEDLGILNAQTPPLDEKLINIVDAGNPENILKALEKRHALSPQDWVEATLMTTNEMIAEAVRNGNRQGLIDGVNAYGQKNKPGFTPIIDFEEATNYFSKIMSTRALAGVQETMDAMQGFNEAINGERAGLLDDVAPALKGMVVNERDKLLDGTSIPVPGSYDETIVEFMQKNSREEREEILKDPEKQQRLFEAIRVIEEDYAKYYGKQASDLPKNASELKTARDPSKPTGHDILARTKAVMTLAGEARWITENFDRDLKDLGLKKGLDETEIIRRGGEDVYQPNVTFRDVNKLYHVGYTSIAARSGFTFKDMGLSALKVWGGVTALANVANSLKEAHGIKHWDKAVEAAISNPFIYMGLGTVYGVNRYRENPKVTRVLTGSPGEKAEIVTHVKLRSLSKKLGMQRLEDFITTESEWNAMRHLKPKQVEQLIETTKTRNPNHPRITKEDLRELVPPEYWVHLPDSTPDGGNDTRRFYFYSKFLTSETNIDQLREHCISWL